MGTLLLVRHGQTDGPLHDRDRLSAEGFRQARALGEAWVANGVRPDAVYVGPCRRHRETLESVAKAYADRGVPFPPATALPSLDEYPAALLFTRLLPQLFEREPGLAAMANELGAGDDASLLRLLEPLGRAWARGDVQDHEVESWDAFAARVSSAVAAMTAGEARGRTVAAFTSAGFVGAATAEVLEIVADRAFGLTLVVRNASVTELLFSGARRSLASFNTQPAPAPAPER